MCTWQSQALRGISKSTAVRTVGAALRRMATSAATVAAADASILRLVSMAYSFPDQSVLASSLDYPRPDPGGHDLGHDHDGENYHQDQAGLVPVEVGERGFERHPEAATADQPQHCGFAHIDVPAKYC